MTWVAVLFAAIGSIGGISGLAAALYIRPTRKKIGAEADKLGVDASAVISGEALKWYQIAAAEAKEAKDEAKACTEQLRALRAHVVVLEQMMREADMTPPPFHWHQIGGAS